MFCFYYVLFLFSLEIEFSSYWVSLLHMHFFISLYIYCVWEIFLKGSFSPPPQIQFSGLMKHVLFCLWMPGFNCFCLLVFSPQFCILYVAPYKSKYFPPFYLSLTNNRRIYTWNLSQNRECNWPQFLPVLTKYSVSLLWVLFNIDWPAAVPPISFWEMVSQPRQILHLPASGQTGQLWPELS